MDNKSAAQIISPSVDVSAVYTRAPDKQWYIMSASYGRVMKAYDLLTSEGLTVYVPMRRETNKMAGKQNIVTKPLMGDFFFVYATRKDVLDFVINDPKAKFIQYCIDRIHKNEYGKLEPTSVRSDEMDNFIRLTLTQDEGILMVDASQCRYRSNEINVITDGKFKGVYGRVARCAGQQRVIISLTGICLVATPYIANAYLKPIGN